MKNFSKYFLIILIIIVNHKGYGINDLPLSLRAQTIFRNNVPPPTKLDTLNKLVLYAEQHPDELGNLDLALTNIGSKYTITQLRLAFTQAGPCFKYNDLEAQSTRTKICLTNIGLMLIPVFAKDPLINAVQKDEISSAYIDWFTDITKIVLSYNTHTSETGTFYWCVNFGGWGTWLVELNQNITEEEQIELLEHDIPTGGYYTYTALSKIYLKKENIPGYLMSLILMMHCSHYEFHETATKIFNQLKIQPTYAVSTLEEFAMRLSSQYSADNLTKFVKAVTKLLLKDPNAYKNPNFLNIVKYFYARCISNKL